jgi:hypothetical protein
MAEAAKIILVRESVWKSWARDGFTFGWLAVLPWFNHTYGGGSGWIYCAIAFAWFITLVARASGQRAKMTMTPAEVRAWLDANHPEGA